MDVLLTDASASMQEGAFDVALGTLLDAWHILPDPGIAHAICALGNHVKTGPSLGGTGDDERLAWREAAGLQRPSDLDRLLETWLDVPAAIAAERSEMLAAWPSDPRRDAAVIALFERIPLKTSSPFWTRLLHLLGFIRDPRLIPRLEALDAVFEARFRSKNGVRIRKKLATALTALLPRLATPRDPLTEDQRTLLREIVERLAPTDAAAERRRQEKVLLSQILDDPADDTPRQIYGDLLSARAHPRGELLALQYSARSSKPSAEQKKRVKALIRDHLAELIGPLIHVVQRRGLRFDRGFLQRCNVDAYEKQHLIDPVIGHPLWSTVEEIACAPASIYEHPVMSSLTKLSLGRAPGESLEHLWSDRRPFEQVESLAVRLASDADAHALGHGGRFPRLDELELYSCSSEPLALLETPLAAQLKSLRVELPWAWLPWLEALQLSSSPCPIPVVTLSHEREHSFRLEKDESGRHTRLTVSFRLGTGSNRKGIENHAVDELVAKLQAIDPANISTLDLDPSRRFQEESAVRRLKRALARFD